MRNAELVETEIRNKINGRNNNLKPTNDTTLMARSKKDLNNLLLNMKEESAKNAKYLNKTQYYAYKLSQSGTSRQRRLLSYIVTGRLQV